MQRAVPFAVSGVRLTASFLLTKLSIAAWMGAINSLQSGEADGRSEEVRDPG